MNLRRIRRIAITTVVVALAVAGTASAQDNAPPPAKKGCEIQLKGPGAGQSVVYQHGYSFSILAQDNKTHTYKCNDGKWEESVSIKAGPVSKLAIVGKTAGTLQAIRL
jgi:hypothetical protein